MNRASKRLRVACPHCGSSRLAHVERALVATRIRRFGRATDGGLVIEEYQGNPRPDFQSSDEVDFPYLCLACEAELQEEDLLVSMKGPRRRPA
ncbi:MAG: hypothetical protein ACYC9L_06780 [Sulfuricaulis sp.]